MRGLLLMAAALAALVASAADLRFAVPAAVAALLAGRWADRVWPALLAFGVTLAAGVLLLAAEPSLLATASVFAAVFVVAGMAPWLAGLAWRQSAALVRAGWDRADQLAHEQHLVGEQARLRERARMAQDLHDALGHDLNLIALRAGTLQLSPELSEPGRDQAREIRAGAAAAIERLGEVIGLLRDQPEPDIAGLVERAASAGVDVRLTGATTDDPLQHRVVQEALTNAIKHAPGSAVEVLVREDAAETVLEVVNGPAGDGTPSTAGLRLGLTGLRERIRLAGGTFSAGPRQEGWAVVARLPHSGESRPAEQRSAQRQRVNRTVTALIVLPLSTLVLLAAALGVWRHQLSSRAVLAADAYAAMRVGQPRSDVASLLPQRQMPNPPRDEPPAGASCEYYAMTRDQFDDRSGDAYRVCFRGGVLVALDIVTE